MQHVTTANYKKTFSIHNYIKTKHINKMLPKNLDSVLRVALEGPIEGCHKIISESIGI